MSKKDENRGVSIVEFSTEIVKALENYKEEVENALKDEIRHTAKEAKKCLVNHPNLQPGSGAYRTGEYLKGFRIKTIAEGYGFLRLRLTNKKFRIGHLLEESHPAGPLRIMTRAFPHWRDAQEYANHMNERFLRRLEK